MPVLTMVFLSLSAQYDQRPAASLTLDGERMRIGRASDCDLRLPDLDVGLHHASLVRHDSSYALVDEGCPSGTWAGDVAGDGPLRPLTPGVLRPLKGLTSAHIGPFWLIFDPSTLGRADGAGARQMFMTELLVRKLRWLGRYPFAALVVRDGPDKDERFDLRAMPGLPYLVGRGFDADFRLLDACVSRKHLEVLGGERVRVRDLNSTCGTKLGSLPLLPWKFVPWGRNLPLRVGRNVIVYENPLAEVIEALDRGERGASAGGALPGFPPEDWQPHLLVRRGPTPAATARDRGPNAESEQGPVESTIRPRVGAPPKEPESPRRE